MRPVNLSVAPAASRRRRVAAASSTTALSSTSSTRGTIQDRRHDCLGVRHVGEYRGWLTGRQLVNRIATGRDGNRPTIGPNATRDIRRCIAYDHEVDVIAEMITSTGGRDGGKLQSMFVIGAKRTNDESHRIQADRTKLL